MKRLIIDEVLKTCQECVFCERDSNYGVSYDSGYNCMSDDAEEMRIVNDYAIDKKGKWPFEFPDWCPLENIEEQYAHNNR